MGTPASTGPAPLFLGIDCHSMPVDDLDAAIAFYAHLGHALLWRDGDHAAGLKLPGSDAELVVHTDRRPAETCLLVASVPEAIARLTAAGAELAYGPIAIRVGRYARLRDPWGNALAILDLSSGLLATDAQGNVIGNQPVK
jgi:predicted enzyme related to lactoylglutathione lyase